MLVNPKDDLACNTRESCLSRKIGNDGDLGTNENVATRRASASTTVDRRELEYRGLLGVIADDDGFVAGAGMDGCKGAIGRASRRNVKMLYK